MPAEEEVFLNDCRGWGQSGLKLHWSMWRGVEGRRNWKMRTRVADHKNSWWSTGKGVEEEEHAYRHVVFLFLISFELQSFLISF